MFQNISIKDSYNEVEKLGFNVNDIARNMAIELSAKKEKIIEQKLIELGVDYEQLKEDAPTRRFKLLMSEQTPTTETWYYNDGSIHGVRLVTFLQQENIINNLNDPTQNIKFECRQSYY